MLVTSFEDSVKICEDLCDSLIYLNNFSYFWNTFDVESCLSQVSCTARFYLRRSKTVLVYYCRGRRMDGVDPVDAFYRVLWTEKEEIFCRLRSVGPRHGTCAAFGTMWNPGSCHGGSGNAEGSTATQGLSDTRDSKHLVIANL